MREKPINLKHVRKFALQRFKFKREHHSRADTEAGTSRSASTSGTASVNASAVDETSNAATTTTTFSKSVTAKKDRQPRTPPTPLTSLRFNQHNERLQHHQYTDVVVGAVDLKKMENNTENAETKPLTNAILTQKPKIQPKYDVHRDVLLHDVVIKKTGYGARDKSIPSGLRQCWQNWSFLSLFAGVVPIVQWLPKYSLKRDFVGDVIAGVTVAIMNIPHGIAYGILAGISPASGLCLAIFPVLVYMVLGTSKHISIGTFAVVAMMTLKVVQTYATEDPLPLAAAAATATTTATPDSERDAAAVNIVTPLEVGTSLAFTVGIVHLIMGFFRLGTLAALLSDPLINGFTTAAAVHVITSQLKDVLGVQVHRYKGAFKIIYTLIDLVKSVPNTNIAAFVFCVGIIVFMTICNECLKPCLRKRCRFPLPAELISVVGGTIISLLLDVNARYGVTLVGTIPKGLPAPVFPRMDLVPLVAVDAISIAIVSYSIVMSLGLTFAKKHSYEVRPNQELFATGMANLISSCFSCYPLACSLSRSVIQDTMGSTQLASLVSASLIIMTMLYAGPFFSALPRCVLAGVIIVAMKPMFMQAKELKKFAKQGKLELLTWIATFSSVVFIDIDIGLLIGVAISLLALYIKGLKPYSALLGVIPDAPAIYVDLNHHRNAVDVPETKIFRYTGSLNFATNMFFRRALYDALGVDSKKIRRASYAVMLTKAQGVNANGETKYVNSFRCLVLDFSMLGHIDVAGCKTLTDVMKEMTVMGVRMFLASPVDRVYDTLVHSMALGEGPFEIFPTLHDAVTYANAVRTA